MPNTKNNNNKTDSWHDSLPFSIPHRRRGGHQQTTRPMMSSTIYKRHEQRLHRNAPLQDDPRGKAVRVLSLLPGMNLLVAPYDPQLHGKKSDNNNNNTSLETSSSMMMFADSNIISFGTTNTSSPSVFTPSSRLSFTTSVGLSGVAAFTAHMFWTRPTLQHSSPFASSVALSSTPSIVLTSTGDLKLFSLPPTRHSTSYIPAVLQSSSVLALPFIVREQLEPGSLANVTAGFVSGCVVAAVQRTTQTTAQPTPTIMLAIATLSLYDAAESNGIWATAMAGAASGAMTGIVRQCGIPRQSMMHATFFVLYRSLHRAVLPMTPDKVHRS